MSVYRPLVWDMGCGWSGCGLQRENELVPFATASLRAEDLLVEAAADGADAALVLAKHGGYLGGRGAQLEELAHLELDVRHVAEREQSGVEVWVDALEAFLYLLPLLLTEGFAPGYLLSKGKVEGGLMELLLDVAQGFAYGLGQRLAFLLDASQLQFDALLLPIHYIHIVHGGKKGDGDEDQTIGKRVVGSLQVAFGIGEDVAMGSLAAACQIALHKAFYLCHRLVVVGMADLPRVLSAHLLNDHGGIVPDGEGVRLIALQIEVVVRSALDEGVVFCARGYEHLAAGGCHHLALVVAGVVVDA